MRQVHHLYKDDLITIFISKYCFWEKLHTFLVQKRQVYCKKDMDPGMGTKEIFKKRASSSPKALLVELQFVIEVSL